MEDLTLAGIKRKNIINKIVFAVLCVLIAILLTFNIVLITNAFFTDARYTNPSVTVVQTGSVAIDYTVKNSSGTTQDSAIILNPGDLVPGDSISYIIEVTNVGKNSCYVRMKCKFEISDDEGEYHEIPIVVMHSRSGFSGFELPVDSENDNGVNYLYCTSAVTTTGNSKTASFPIKFEVSEDVDMELNEYTGKAYKITVIIEAIQTEGVELSNSYGWIDSETDDPIII